MFARHFRLGGQKLQDRIADLEYELGFSGARPGTRSPAASARSWTEAVMAASDNYRVVAKAAMSKVERA